MPYKSVVVAVALSVVCLPAIAQNTWNVSHRLELRADYRWSDEESHPAPFPPGSRLRTPDLGHHVELNVADLQLDAGYGDLFAMRAKVHVQAKHRRNPTSTDQQVDADELFVRFGPKPEFLDRPSGTTVFLQAGKFPKMERQPVRLLESYGLAATAFNRFEDTQVLVGGTIGRSLYWRVQAANGNPLFFRDPNALAGDNGTDDRIAGRPTDFGSGFPILYNSETEDLFFNTENVQVGEAIGYRWQRDDQTAGIDAIVFHYQRDMADRVELTGTNYGGDLDLLVLDEIPGVPPRGFPIEGRKKREIGARVFVEWHAATFIGQYTTQTIAGLDRQGWELEAGYRFPFAMGPVESIQPAVRASGINNDFGRVIGFPAPSLWWNWRKYDAGVRVGLKRGLDVTIEYTTHEVESVEPVNLREALVTVRWRV
ncbi:MAG TPA: hypothetical protein VGQ36_06120 [Thermoanaerobaculia bacterium]|jgi:hypothetical protein|nr:hypothetical protein [Thermoanaerobaculia bacterium]